MSQPPTDKIAEHWLIEGDKTLGMKFNEGVVLFSLVLFLLGWFCFWWFFPLRSWSLGEGNTEFWW